MEQHANNIIEQIHASYYQLTNTERRVADYVLTQREQVQYMSITQLADECGVADATISRFCRSLQLKGFNAFKLELARLAAAPVKTAAVSESANVNSRTQEVGRLAAEAVQQTIALVDPKQVEAAVNLIEKASRVMCVGSGSSMIMANECVYLFSNVSDAFFGVADLHAQISSVAAMSPNDLMILFSYSGATTIGVQLLELARSRGIKTILITRFSKSPAAKLADVVLRCGSNEGPYQLGSVPAKVAQLVVTDILYQEYYHRNQDACEKTIHSIAAALADVHI